MIAGVSSGSISWTSGLETSVCSVSLGVSLVGSSEVGRTSASFEESTLVAEVSCLPALTHAIKNDNVFQFL